FFFFSSRRRHTRFSRDWSSDVCSSDLGAEPLFGFLNFLLRFRDFFSKRSSEFSSITSTDTFLVSVMSFARSSSAGSFCPDLLSERNSCVWLTLNLCQFVPLFS